MSPDTFIKRKIIGLSDDCKNIGTCYGYSYGNVDGSGIYGAILSLNPNGNQFQLKINNNGNKIKFRAYDAGLTTWSDWREIVTK